MGVVDGAARSVSRTVNRAASATTAAAGAVGGAAVNGVAGAVTGAAAGVQKGIDRGSHSTPAAALTLRAVTLGLQATSALVSTGVTMAAIPVREGARALSVGLPAPTLTRHSWCGRGRAWVEVRGLDGPDGAELGRFVVEALRARPGVE